VKVPEKVRRLANEQYPPAPDYIWMASGSAKVRDKGSAKVRDKEWHLRHNVIPFPKSLSEDFRPDCIAF